MEQNGLIDFYKNLFRRQGFQRFAVLAGLILILYLARELLNVFLLTFILTFLMYSAQKFLAGILARLVKIHQKLLISILYIFLAGAIIFGIYKIVPLIVDESTEVVKQAVDFVKKPHNGPVAAYLSSIAKDFNFPEYIASNAEKGAGIIIKYISSVGTWGMNVLLAFILSLFFLLEKHKVTRFTNRFAESKISFIYRELSYFGSKFIHSFGKVIENQIIIAFVNGVLSTIALAIMGFHNVFGLGIMIFLLGLVPVAGVFISLIPLSMIAFNMGGFIEVVYMIIMIAVLHAIESYVLNPKLMSARMELPVFYTFIILVISEHFLGIWGLIIGIPIFMFLLDILDVKDREGRPVVMKEKPARDIGTDT